MQSWLREHWRGPVIGLVAFIVGVGIGASGSESDEASREAQDQVASLQREIGEAEAKREVAEDEVSELTSELDRASERAVKVEGEDSESASVSTPAPEPEAEPANEEEEEPAEAREPPNVVGLPLPAARQVMKQAGFRVAPKNTDTAFGIVVEANYTICSQGQPRAGIVPVLAQKYGC